MKHQGLQQLEARTDSLDPDSVSSYDTNVQKHKQLVIIKIGYLDCVMHGSAQDSHNISNHTNLPSWGQIS